MTNEIRVLVVEDHFVARLGIRQLVQDASDMCVVAEATSGAEAVRLFREHRPDVVLMDLRLPGLDGIQATSAICSETPDARVLFLSTYAREAEVRRALRAGALGYVLKDADSIEILRAIRCVHRGDRHLPPALARVLEDGERDALNARELRILELMAEGRSNPEIAAATGLAASTVRVYITAVFQQLGVKNRTEAVAAARARGLVRER